VRSGEKVTRTVSSGALHEVLKRHEKWLYTDGREGECADLCGLDLRGYAFEGVDLRYALLRYSILAGVNLRKARLQWADLTGADLRNADVSKANFRDAKLEGASLEQVYAFGACFQQANLIEANFSRAKPELACFMYAIARNASFVDARLFFANFREAFLEGVDFQGAYCINTNFRAANLTKANFQGTYLDGADLVRANLSGSQGMVDPIEFIRKNFETTEEGILVYKVFGHFHSPNPDWTIAREAIIEETVNYDRSTLCTSGISVATLDWIKKNAGCSCRVWKCLVRWEWLPGICVPYRTDGKIRVSRLQLLEQVDMNNENGS